MKILMFVSFLLVGLVYSTPVETSDGPDENMQILKMKAIYNYLNKKCENENDSPKHSENFFSEMAMCLEPYGPSSFEEMIGKPGFFDDTCKSPEKMEKVADCFLPAIEILKACGGDEEKYLPEFIIDAIRNLMNFACADEGKNIQKLNQDSVVKCYVTLENDAETMSNSCTVEGNNFIAMMDDGVLTKKELCDAMEADKVCYMNTLEKKCPDDSNMKEFYEGIMDAMTGPCSK